MTQSAGAAPGRKISRRRRAVALTEAGVDATTLNRIADAAIDGISRDRGGRVDHPWPVDVARQR